ncbi:MAG TPA: TorF family putative porin [Dokdonella sp.]|nr:TorF family putative porin [Dokdonella sp.]
MSRLSVTRPRRLLLALASLAAVSTAQAVTFNGNATLTTDYVWRGSTQSDSDPAAQAGFKVSGDNGFYASVWGSSIKFAPELDASTELDLTLGWGRSLSDDWAVDVNVLRYVYPGTSVDLDWTELNGTLTWRNNYWLSAGWSNEALGYDHSGLYTQVGARFPLNDRFRLEAMVSHYFLSRDVVAKSGYTHAQVNAIWAFHAPFELRLSGHATDSNAKAIFGDDYAGSRVEAALQASF